MKNSLILITLIISIQIYGQVNSNIDFTTEIKKYDISDLLTHDKFNIENDTVIINRQQPLGYIGDNFQRLHIRFISVIKNPSNPLEYLVYGKTKVKNNICAFQGIMTVNKSELYEASEFPGLKQGFVSGDYNLFEDPDQRGTGLFKGDFITFFYFDEKNKLKYDALMFVADGFANNQFEGTWTSYLTGNSKKCNWGDYRIPDSDNLDVGVGEFGPDEKYKDFGWDSYRLAWGYSSDKPGVLDARKKENEKWWIDKQ